jgi:hypothetical protein
MFLRCRGGTLRRGHDALRYKSGEEPPLVVCLVDRVSLSGFRVVGVRQCARSGITDHGAFVPAQPPPCVARIREREHGSRRSHMGRL